MLKPRYVITLDKVVDAYQKLPKGPDNQHTHEYADYLQASAYSHKGLYYPGGYEGNLSNYIKDAERGCNQAYLTRFIDTQLPNIGLAALLQQFIYITPKLEQFLGYNQELLHTPNRLLLQCFHALALPTRKLYDCWFDNLTSDRKPDQKPKLHILFTSLVVFSPGLQAYVLPGTLEAVYSLTAQGYRFDYLAVSNQWLRNLILCENQGPPLPTLESDDITKEAYLRNISQRLVPEFLEHKKYLLKEVSAVLDQCSYRNTFYYQVLQQIRVCLQLSDDCVNAALQSFIDNLSEKRELFANFAKNPDFLPFINAIQVDDFRLQLSSGSFSGTSREHYILSFITRIACIAVIRLQFLPEQAELLHYKLRYHVTWPCWLEERAQALLSSYSSITQDNAAIFLQEYHDVLFGYAIGYYEYLAWIRQDLENLEPSLPQYVSKELKRKIQAAEKAHDSLFQTQNIQAWFNELDDLHTIFQILVDEAVRSKLKSLERLSQEEKSDLLKVNFYGFSKNKRELKICLKNYIASLTALNYFHNNKEKAYSNIDQLFNHVKCEFKRNHNYFIAQLAPYYLAAAFNQHIKFFEFTEKDLNIFDRCDNDELLKKANSLIEEKMKFLSIAAKNSNLYHQAQLRHYYTQRLQQALHYRCSLNITHLDPGIIDKILTLNDRYYYRSIMIGLLALGGAISLFTARTVLFMSFLVLQKLPLSYLLGMAIIGNPPVLVLGVIFLSVASIEFTMLTQGIKKLKGVRHSFFYPKASPLGAPAVKSEAQSSSISFWQGSQYTHDVPRCELERKAEENTLRSWLLPDNRTLTPVL